MPHNRAEMRHRGAGTRHARAVVGVSPVFRTMGTDTCASESGPRFRTTRTARAWRSLRRPVDSSKRPTRVRFALALLRAAAPITAGGRWPEACSRARAESEPHARGPNAELDHRHQGPRLRNGQPLVSPAAAESARRTNAAGRLTAHGLRSRPPRAAGRAAPGSLHPGSCPAPEALLGRSYAR